MSKSVWKRRGARVVAAFLTVALVTQGSSLPAIAAEVIPQDPTIYDASSDDAASTEAPATEEGTESAAPVENQQPAVDEGAATDAPAQPEAPAAPVEEQAQPAEPADTAVAPQDENLAGGGLPKLR